MIDTEMYQLISLGLGAFLLLVTLLVLSTLGKINKNLENLRSGSPAAAEASPQPEAHSEQASEQAPEPAAATETYSQQPVTASPAAQISQIQEPAGQTQGWAAPEAAAQTQTTSEPVVASAPQQASPEVATPQPAATEQIPEEQPFERDGRWWFKRGLEILVYDEQTGQWKPEPNNPFTGTTSAGAAPAASGAAPSTGTSDVGAVTTQVPTQDQGFWKCPSCGAVNGATSASCRMCFAARP